MFESLAKIFYTNGKSHAQIYKERFYSPSAVHLPITIRQFNHDRAFQAFFYYNQDLSIALEKIYLRFSDFLSILPKLALIIQRQFALASIVDEVHSTSDIEGIHSTHRELRDIIDGGGNNQHFSSIIKMYDLLSSGDYPQFSTCEDVRRFYDEFVHQDAIAYDFNNRLDGKLFRKEGVDVKNPSGKIIHRGVEPEGKIIAVMSEALHFLNSDEYPALIRIAIFHYLFVYIHPFYDGNGRTARFISSCYLAQHLHPLVALRLAVTIKRHKGRYYSLLKETDAEINCGDITPFILGFLQFVADTLLEINSKLQHKLTQLKRMKQALFSVLPHDEDTQNIAWAILQACTFYGRGASIEELIAASGKTRNTVMKKLATMPVRTLTNVRKHFYKIDWAAMRYLAH